MSALDSCIAGRYRLTARIAIGGMGEVWRGRDERLQRDIAVKLLRPEHADSAEFRARLRIEAQSAAAISCARVVQVYDCGEERDEDGRLRSFIVMELVDGEPLSRLLAREAALPFGQVSQLIMDTATALAQAHRLGVIHRDIKPANLLIGLDGHVKVADFGIARARDTARLTATGTVVGTATYMAPEQVEGRPVSPASDIFSLGVVAYQCLTGYPPYVGDGEIATALARLRQSPPALPPAVPPAMADLVRRMLAKDPDQRPTAEGISGTAPGSLTHGPVADPGVSEPSRPDPATALFTAPTAAMPSTGQGSTTRRMPPASGDHGDNRRRSLALATLAGLLLLAVVFTLAGALGHSATNTKGSAGRAPKDAGPSTVSKPTAHPGPTLISTPKKPLVAPAGSAVRPKHHIPPGHANNHGPKKNKHAHPHGDNQGDGADQGSQSDQGD